MLDFGDAWEAMRWRAERLGPETAERLAAILRDEQAAAEQKSIAEAYERAKRVRSLRELRMPLSGADEDRILWGAPDETPAHVATRAWVANPSGRPWLVLCGPVGRGKTFAAAHALFAARGRYVGARELERLGMAKFGDEQAQFQQLLDGRGLLVIDDVGREDDIGRMQSALLDIVDYRRGSGIRTVLITNFAKKAFCDRYSDARLQSRLHECAQWFADAGDDMRRST